MDEYPHDDYYNDDYGDSIREESYRVETESKEFIKDYELKDNIIKLNYPPTDEIDDLLDELNMYDTANGLYLNSNSIHSMPKNLLKFKGLEYFHFSGTRPWDITVDQLPTTLKVIIMDVINLNNDFLDGIEQFDNLEYFYCNSGAAYHSHIRNKTLVELKGLPKIVEGDLKEGFSAIDVYKMRDLPALKKVILQVQNNIDHWEMYVDIPLK